MESFLSNGMCVLICTNNQQHVSGNNTCISGNGDGLGMQVSSYTNGNQVIINLTFSQNNSLFYYYENGFGYGASAGGGIASGGGSGGGLMFDDGSNSQGYQGGGGGGAGGASAQGAGSASNLQLITSLFGSGAAAYAISGNVNDPSMQSGQYYGLG